MNEEVLYLEDYFPNFEFEDDDHLRINGKVYAYSITLNPDIPDDRCCRVQIEGQYYYFG